MKILTKRVDLGFFPTPLHRLVRLSREYQGYDIWIKRDDQTGLASGGNKTRKLEYLLYQAKMQDCDTIITAGAQQSNHCRQTAAACQVAGFDCHLVTRGHEPEHYQGNLLLDKILGATIHFSGDKDNKVVMEELARDLESRGKKVYLVPYGGSNPTGTLGYVHAVKEVKKQFEQQGFNPDFVFFASSSGGTQAGLMAGKDFYGMDFQLVPISVDKTDTKGEMIYKKISQLVNDCLAGLACSIKKYTPGDIPFITDYNQPGYGVVTGHEKNAIHELAQAEGIILDPVYTARAFHGMTSYLKEKRIPEGASVLFWHTGGLPAIFDSYEKLQ